MRARHLRGTVASLAVGGVIFQIYVRSFADSNGDGIGDLPGIAAHLDYLTTSGSTRSG